ncbi:MAG: argininosuccinate synthase [Deltaproteobacteria bacterium]|nr:argininosuccinate synthase [Deltaproteobacteria bacterium]
MKDIPNPKKIVLAYSGGLDTSVIVAWLRDHYGAEVVCFTADVGQGDDPDELRKKALASGACEFVYRDLREEFVRDFVFEAVRANAIYENRYYLGTALARPIIAKAQIEVAHETGSDAVAHGSTGKGNDQVRFEVTYMAMDPYIRIIAPWRHWDFSSRTELMDYARKLGVPIEQSTENPYSKDKNLLHLSFEGGVLEDPFVEPPAETYEMARDPSKAPTEPDYVEIGFVDGTPTSVDGTDMRPHELLNHLNVRAGKYGIGRVDMVENRLVGIKSRGIYETPGGAVLHAAHRDLEGICLDRETMHFKDVISLKYAEMIYYGLWYQTLRQALGGFVQATQQGVTGTVRMKLLPGSCMPVGRKAESSLYDPKMATFEKEDVYDQLDAEGFIRLFGLQVKAKRLIAGLE